MRINHLRLVRQGSEIFQDLELRSDAHRIGLVGPNGAGKSSLLLALQGLLTPTSGAAELSGRSGLVFQNCDHQLLFPTVMEELCFGALQHGRQDAEKCAAVLAMDHGADHLLHLAIDELSEGQRQLVCLLAVLIDRPETVLLDEPFTGLDHRLTGRLMQTLLRLPQRLIVATHRLELLENFEEVIWIEGGRVQMQGPANTVLPIYSRSGT